MTDENTEGQQQPSPLAAERERLRQAGYTEAEISQILVARAVGGGDSEPSAGAAPAQGTMTGCEFRSNPAGDSDFIPATIPT